MVKLFHEKPTKSSTPGLFSMKTFLATVICALTFLVLLSVFMMWPPFCRYTGPSGNICLSNLLQIAGAKEQYRLETGQTNGLVTTEVPVGLYISKPLVCNSGGVYTYGKIGENPVCSLATGTMPVAVKERVGLFGWRWKIWPSRQEGHKLPE
jgi:hypothetical protein